MASYKEKLNWANCELSQYGFRMKKYSWTQSYLKGFYDFESSFTVDGVNHTGRGIDRRPLVASVKSLCESLESYIMSQGSFVTSSSGLSVHVDRHAAYKHALNEIVERDCFLTHYLTKTPFHTISDDISNYVSICTKVGLNVRFGLGYSAFENLSTVICKIDLSAFDLGFVIGLGTSETLSVAIEKSFLEAYCRSIPFVAIVSIKSSPLSRYEFASKKQWCSTDHYRIGLCPDNKSMENMFSTKSFVKKYKAIDFNSIDLIERNVCDHVPLIAASKFGSVYLTSDKLQRHFTGPTSNSKINQERLSQFRLSLGIVKNVINDIPHPLG